MEPLENYQKEKLTIDLVKANVYAILIIVPVFAIYGFTYYLIWHSKYAELTFRELLKIPGKDSVRNIGLFLVIFIAGIILHEFIHGITWAIFTKKGFRSIKFGVMWKMLTPYCHCKEPLLIRHYLLGAIMPAIILGIIPSIVSMIIGNPGLLFFGLIFTVSAIGDFMIIYLLRKEKMDTLVLDHPSEAGCYVFRKIEE